MPAWLDPAALRPAAEIAGVCATGVLFVLLFPLVHPELRRGLRRWWAGRRGG